MTERPIAIIAATPDEAKTLRDRMLVEETTRRAGVPLIRGRLAEQEAVLAQSSYGKINAAMVSQLLIDRFEAAALIAFGTAGAVAPELVVGDVVIGERLIVHDMGVYLGERCDFVHLGAGFHDEQGRERFYLSFRTDPRLVELAQVASQSLTFEQRGSNIPQVHCGVIATGDQAVFSRAKKEWLRETFEALAVEMEGAAVAQVAIANSLPWLVVRGISDPANESVELDLGKLAIYADQGPGAELISLAQKLTGLHREVHPVRASVQTRQWQYLLSQPSRIVQALHLQEDLRLAARNAARLVEEVVARWEN